MSARASHTHMHAHAHTHTRTHTHSHTLGPTLMTLLVGSGTTKGRCTLTAALVNPQWLWISAPGERTENIVSNDSGKEREREREGERKREKERERERERKRERERETHLRRVRGRRTSSCSRE